MSVSVKRINIYPIKGLSAQSLQCSRVLKQGLEYDRRLMLIDENRNFISQRCTPELIRFKVEVLNGILKLSNGNDNISCSYDQENNEVLTCTIWEHSVKAVEFSKRISSWFSNHLNKKVKLVKMAKDFKRIKKYSSKEGSTEVSFADGYPILFLGTASINLLNSKLDMKIESSRFRPNLILETKIPHEEDKWSQVRIGNSHLEVIKACARCQVVNIDQQSGEIFKEPLATLSSYRKIQNKIYFGANVSCLKEGKIEIGDILNFEIPN